MRGWLAASGTAARIAADRIELWAPATLASLAFLGWLPITLAVVPLPDTAGLTFFGADLISSGTYPLNVILLGLAGLFGILTCCLLVALGEAALQRALRPLIGAADAASERDSLTGETAVVFVVLLVALLPAAAALVGLALWIAAVAPGEFMSPDFGGTPITRVALTVAPGILVVAIVAIAAQAFGGAVERRSIGPSAEALLPAMRHALGDLLVRPAVTLGTLGVTALLLVVQLVVGTLVLRILWAPIGTALSAGELATPSTILLLVGFVAIWLCLLLAGGALHAWASAWWSLELRRPPSERSAAT